MEPMERTIGAHTVRFEPPDIFHCYFNGPVAVEDAKLAFEIMDKEIVPEVGNNFYFVAHLPPSAKGTSSETRRYAASVKPKWKAAIIIGGSVLSRAAINMVLRTAMAMSGTSVPLRMVSNEEQAYALLSEWRGVTTPGGGRP
jgi:hypothetical protein